MKRTIHFTPKMEDAVILQKFLSITRVTLFLFLLFSIQAMGNDSYSKITKLTLDLENTSLRNVLVNIEENSEFYFLYSSKIIDVEQKMDVNIKNEDIFDVLDEVLAETDIQYDVKDRQILLSPNDIKYPELPAVQQTGISGKVTSEEGLPLPGVTVIIKGTVAGTVTNVDGQYNISAQSDDILVFSFIGMKTQEVAVGSQTVINATMESDVFGIEEVVAIGYGTVKREDLTGSIVSGDIEAVQEQANVSLMEGLLGSVAGLNIEQVDEAGEDPEISVRGQSTLSGETDPLIVVDGVIYRGSLIDINPNDIKSVDILRDASSKAIYGSQASNGVIQIVTTGGKGEPSIKYTGRFSLQRPHHEVRAEMDGAKFMKKIEHSDLVQSRTEESGYLEPNPDWAETTNFKTNHEITQFELGRTYDWYDGVTTDNPYIISHNISVSNSSEKSNYFGSIGYTEQDGHMIDEYYERINGRFNFSSSLTDWFDLDFQSFVTISEWGPQELGATDRFIEPFATPYDENGVIVQRPYGNPVNPLIEIEADKEDKRFNLGANITGNVFLPVKGLKYQMRFGNNYETDQLNYFGSHGNSFTGEGYKRHRSYYTMSLDNILTYSRLFNKIHQVDVTLLYGIEKREHELTRAEGLNFANHVLGFDLLQAADAALQAVESGGWEESSLYNMGRISYKLMDKYLVNATIRRDGFSGFSKENKFGYFPSLALGWVISEESFLKSKISWLDRVKIRASYGATGNRTIGRYQTLAKVEGTSGYVTSDASSIYTQWINDLASPDLRWETTTGINLGIDFRLLDSRLNGSIDYYNNNTTDLLYEVDIPAISRYEVFPDNLGKIHNYGIEGQLTSINIRSTDLSWTTNFTFSIDRDEIKELLGFDLDGDGKEDDLISEGLFINESLGTIYDYRIDGIWQLGEDIPGGYEFGSYRVIDMNGDGEIIPGDDKIILGNEEPSYRFSINNVLNYKNWTLRLFVNSEQGGKKWFLGEDTMYGFSIFNTETHFNQAFPQGADYWSPENPDSKYQRPGIKGSDGIRGTQYTSRSYIRLRNLSLSYRFTPNRINFVKDIKLILSGRNLLTITNWPGWDPDTGEGYVRNRRPVMESYSLGIDVTF